MKHKNLYLRGSVFLVILRLFLMLPVNARWIINRPADCTGEVSSNSKKNEPVCYIDTDTINNRYTTIEAALAAANDGSEHKVVVIPNTEAVVITKSCFISSGVELVLPYGTTDALVVAFAGPVKTYNISLNSKPSTTVILDSGVSINILSGGTLTLNGQMGACDAGTSKTSGVTFGQYSEMNLSDNASINIQNGGTLNCWGLIREVNKKEDHLGKVSYSYTSGLNADSNNSVIDVQGTLNLPFTVYDWQGGGASVKMTLKSIFPLQKFDAPNVFPEITISSNGSMWGKLSVVRNNSVSDIDKQCLIGQNKGLINYSSGQITWDYEDNVSKKGINQSLSSFSDHLTSIKLMKGEASVGSFSVKLPVVSDDLPTTVKTEDYLLPLGNQFSLRLSSGEKFTIGNKLMLLPGCSVLIDQGATCTVTADFAACYFPTSGTITSKASIENHGSFIFKGNYQIWGLKYTKFGGSFIGNMPSLVEGKYEAGRFNQKKHNSIEVSYPLYNGNGAYQGAEKYTFKLLNYK